MIPWVIWLLDGTQMKQVFDLWSDRELRQNVVQNDKISLSAFAPEH